MRKAVKVILTTGMFCLMTVSAMAAENGKITINEAVSGQRYSIYRLFDLAYTETTGVKNSPERAYAYKLNSAWEPFFVEGAPGRAYVEIGNSGYVTLKEDIDIQTFAREALAYARGIPGILPVQSQAAGCDVITFEGLDLGYYLIDSTVGTLCELDSTDREVVITEKNKQPTVEKRVREGEDFRKENDAQIGDIVTYCTTISAMEGAQNYILHDTMGKGLEFDPASVTVVKKTADGQETVLRYREDFRIQAGYEDEDPCTFEIVFSQILCDELRDDDQILVTYQAKITADAVIEGEGNPNSTYLAYGEGNAATVRDTTSTYVFEIDVFKHNTSGEALAGAVFELSRDTEEETALSFVHAPKSNTYRAAAAGEQNTVTEMETGKDGKLHIEGLDSGVYYLRETKAPVGYNLLRAPIAIVITRENNSARIACEYDGDPITPPDSSPKTVDVENQAGLELPSTGGTGTAAFYISGILILTIGTALLIYFRKHNEDEE